MAYSVGEADFDSTLEASLVSPNRRPKRPTTRFAGRLVARRPWQSLVRAPPDEVGRVQIYVKRDDIGEEEYERFLDLDIETFSGRGILFRTRTGEISIHVSSFTLLAKCLVRCRS